MMDNYGAEISAINTALDLVEQQTVAMFGQIGKESGK
jgi:hypothetical protein